MFCVFVSTPVCHKPLVNIPVDVSVCLSVVRMYVENRMRMALFTENRMRVTCVLCE